MAVILTTTVQNFPTTNFKTWSAGTYLVNQYVKYTINNVLRLYISLKTTTATPSYVSTADWSIVSQQLIKNNSTGGGTYNTGDSVTIVAATETGWTFVNWTKSDGSVESTDANHTFTAPATNETYTANYVKDSAYTIESVNGMLGCNINVDDTPIIPNSDRIVIEKPNGMLGCSINVDDTVVIAGTERIIFEKPNGMLGASIEIGSDVIKFPQIKRLN